MKIYTKTGDKGLTYLYGGKRESKNSAIISVIGGIDELNSFLGVVLSELPATQSTDVKEKLLRIQSELLRLGADLATPLDFKQKQVIERIKSEQVTQLEKEIDYWQKQLPVLRNFVLPGGNIIAARLFYARTLCRRAERMAVAALVQTQINSIILPFLNRLSDWLFVMARFVNHVTKSPEVIWRGK